MPRSGPDKSCIKLRFIFFSSGTLRIRETTALRSFPGLGRMIVDPLLNPCKTSVMAWIENRSCGQL